MKLKKISFITPITSERKIVLQKEYTKTYTFLNNSTIDLSSNIGPRNEQQDSIAVSENNGYLLMLVADGVGGLDKGEEASYTVSNIIKNWFESQSITTLEELNEIKLKQTITEIINYIREEILPYYAGTTLNISIVGPRKTIIINIGDSRAYIIKDKKMNLISKDHSLAFEMFNPTTKKDRDMLRFYTQNNLIMGVIQKDIEPIISLITLKNEDYDILCHMTDGISDILEEDKIKKCLLNLNPALSLTKKATTSGTKHRPYTSGEFLEYISPHDNASAVVYTKKRKL